MRGRDALCPNLPGRAEACFRYACGSPESMVRADALYRLGVRLRRDRRFAERAGPEPRRIVPIRDERGRVRGFGARALNPDDPPKYLNSPQSSLFDKRFRIPISEIN